MLDNMFKETIDLSRIGSENPDRFSWHVFKFSWLKYPITGLGVWYMYDGVSAYSSHSIEPEDKEEALYNLIEDYLDRLHERR